MIVYDNAILQCLIELLAISIFNGTIFVIVLITEIQKYSINMGNGIEKYGFVAISYKHFKMNDNIYFCYGYVDTILT